MSWMGLQIKNRRAAAMRQEAHETAISACDSAEATRKTIQSDLDRTTAKASRLLKDTSRGQVADPKTLDALNRLLDAKTSTIKGSCAPDAVTSDVDRTTAALRRTTKELKNRLTDSKTAPRAVTATKLAKTGDDPNALNKPVSYTHLRAHETGRNLVGRLLLEKKKKNKPQAQYNYLLLAPRHFHSKKLH